MVQSGTAWLNVNPAETGPPTPATVTTVGCSSTPPHGPPWAATSTRLLQIKQLVNSRSLSLPNCNQSRLGPVASMHLCDGAALNTTALYRHHLIGPESHPQI